MKKILFLLPLFFIFSGCTNPYSSSYTNLTKWVDTLSNPSVIVPTGKANLIQGSNLENDNTRMLENGYLLLGISSFNAGTTSQNLAIQHAKKIHARTIIVYSQYTNTLSGSMPLTVPDTQTSYHSGNIYGSGGGFANYSGSSTTYGTRTTYMPYHVRRYDYYATFWIKAKPASLGIHFNDLTNELRRKVESNKGVCITVVVKNSPAFNADLLGGDIIQKCNNIDVVHACHFANLIAGNNGKQIELEIFRNGKTIVKQIQLNKVRSQYRNSENL